MRFPVCLSIKHLQRLAAFQRHAIRLPPLQHAIRQLLPILLPFPLRIAILVAFPPPAPRQRHAIRQLLRLAIPAANRVAIPAILAANLAAILAANRVAFPAILAASPAAFPAVPAAAPAPSAATLAATDFADVMAALTLYSEDLVNKLAGLAL